MPEIMYKLDHVTKIFSGNTSSIKAVDDVSLEIYKGEIFGIIGMSGAGKSTLVRTLNRLEEIDSGEIIYDDVSIINSLCLFKGEPHQIVSKAAIESALGNQYFADIAAKYGINLFYAALTGSGEVPIYYYANAQQSFGSVNVLSGAIGNSFIGVCVTD